MNIVYSNSIINVSATKLVGSHQPILRQHLLYSLEAHEFHEVQIGSYSFYCEDPILYLKFHFFDRIDILPFLHLPSFRKISLIC